MNGSELGAVPAPQEGGAGAGGGDNDGDSDGDNGSARSPFAEYAWMEHEEEFNRQVEEELQEQEFLDRCFQEMLEEEERDWFIPARDLPQGTPAGEGPGADDILSKSNLNPDAKEFVPGVKY